MSTKRAFANREQKKRYIRFARLQHSTVLLMATCLSFVAVCLLIADQLFRPDLFSIDKLQIKGTFKHLQPQHIEQVVTNKAQGNFFAINLDEIRHEVEKLQWVQAVDVRRQWPDTLLVDVIEHKPIMRWGKNKWLNSKGAVVELGGFEFKEGEFKETELGSDTAFQQPIILYGDEKDALLIMQQVNSWSQLLDALGMAIKEASLSSTHAWTLKLNKTNNDNQQIIELLLGRQDIEQRFARFVDIYKNNFQFMDIRLKKVDARYPNGLAVTQVKQIALRNI